MEVFPEPEGQKKQFIPSINFKFMFRLKSPSFFLHNNIIHCLLLVFNNFSKIISEIKIAKIEINIEIKVNLKAIASPLVSEEMCI